MKKTLKSRFLEYMKKRKETKKAAKKKRKAMRK